MKGLLLKDFYMMIKYCRSYLIIAIVFVAISFADSSNTFFVFYPAILCGMLPVNLLSYDERSKWLQYSETMPYTKAQIVSGKYIIGIATQSVIIIITGIAQAIQMIIGGTFSLEVYASVIILILVVSLITSSVILPFIFKLGVEKGRMAYYIMIGIVCATTIMTSNFLLDDRQSKINFSGILPIICVVGILIYVLSWRLSIAFYKKREL